MLHVDQTYVTCTSHFIEAFHDAVAIIQPRAATPSKAGLGTGLEVSIWDQGMTGWLLICIRTSLILAEQSLKSRWPSA